jgi:hypothetical protein
MNNEIDITGAINARAGKAYFPGNCRWTGYCADDDFIEAVYESMAAGSTLTEALESLGDVAVRLMQADLHQDCEAGSMLANWEDRKFTDQGIEV